MTNNDQRLGEKALSKVAEIGISSQLDEVENLDVEIRTDPIKVVQGEVNSVAITGKGMVVKQDLRMESLEVNTDSVSINPLSAMFGNLELTEPTNAEAQIVLSEADLNRALKSDYLNSKTQNLKLNIDGKLVPLSILRSRLRLPGEGRFLIDADFSLPQSDELKHIKATVVPHLVENEQRISLEILSAEGQGLTPELVNAILQQITTLLDFRNFEIPGMTLHLKRFDVQPGQIIIYAKAIIEKLDQATSDD